MGLFYFMKRYLVFAFNGAIESLGGMNDCFLITADHKEALYLAKRLCVDYAIVEIHDLQSDTVEIVSDCNHERMD